MRIEIESIVMVDKTCEPLIILNDIIKVALKCKSLNDLSNRLKNIDTFGFIYGFGSSHCWVKQINNNNRILLITEK